MSAKLPSEPSTAPPANVSALPEPSFGWTQYAEKTNGRFAMIGFLALLITELLTQQDFITWLGLR
ncbi:MAG: chlorophyll a/b-binding protein [Phormidesmis sp.]